MTCNWGFFIFFHFSIFFIFQFFMKWVVDGKSNRSSHFYDFSKKYQDSNQFFFLLVETGHGKHRKLIMTYTAWKISKYGVISGPYFPAFSLKIGKYEPEITSYLDTFHAVMLFSTVKNSVRKTADINYELDQLNLLFECLCIAQKVKFSIKDFFSECDQVRRKLWIWSYLLKKSLMENFVFLCSDI